MPPTAPTQHYKAGMLIGGLALPMYSGGRLSCPKNFAVPDIIGNYWDLNYAEGFRQPTVDCQLCVRDKATECLATAFLNYFFTRTSDAAHNTSEIAGGIKFWTGRRGFILGGAKADSFSLSTSKGEDLAFSCRFMGTTLTVDNTPVVHAWDTSPPLRFQNLNFAGLLQDIVWRFGLSFSNNSYPNMALNGSVFPIAINAGKQTSALNVEVQEFDTYPPDGSAASFTIAGLAVTRTFNMPRIIVDNPDDMNTAPPGIMRPLSYRCLGGDGTVTPPLYIS